MKESNRDIDSYPVRVLVAGSRDWSNYQYFDSQMHLRVEMLLQTVPKKNICFISGKASYGPDDMIIYWCEQNGYMCFEYPADWDKYPRAAGIIRNITMGKVATHAILFWDGISTGTKHMKENVASRGIPYVVYNVKRSSERSKHYRRGLYG